MKNIYTKTFLLILFILPLFLPVTLTAQCFCDGGVPATPIVQTVTLPPTTASSLVFTFQQFDPSVGTLSCVTLNDTISGVSTTGALNKAPLSKFYKFQLTLNNNIAGPGISIDYAVNKIYGPDLLAPYGNPADTITYGPDSVFTGVIGSGTTGGNAAYLGAGTVDFTYTINGGMIALSGGTNYNSGISTTIGGTLGLTYFFCPLSLLSANLQNFSAYKSNDNIVLKWDAQNAETINQFTIEYSTNGKDFTDLATVPVNQSSPSGSYNYNYAVNSNDKGYIYFRIKQTAGNNKTGYSAVEKVLLSEKTGMGMAIHPNPAITGIGITFDHLLNGDYSVDLINTAGQVIVNRKVKLSNANTIPVNWNTKPAPGIYFTRVTNTSTMEQQIIRVVIQ
jgi:hypothetical protein